MNLSDYLKKNSISTYRFADLIGANQAHVHRIASGSAYASAEMAMKIFDATHGEVSVHEVVSPKNAKMIEFSAESSRETIPASR